MQKIKSGKFKNKSWQFSKYNLGETLSIPKGSLILLPDHSGKIIIHEGGRKKIHADGVISCNPNMVFMKTADCIPVIVWWDDSDWYGVLHFGFRGLFQDITRNLKKLAGDLDLPIGKANFIFGPSICKNCYTHNTLVRKLKWQLLRAKYPKFSSVKKGSYLFDLSGAYLSQLNKIGISPRRITSFRKNCTNCNLDTSRHYKISDSDIVTIVGEESIN